MGDEECDDFNPCTIDKCEYRGTPLGMCEYSEMDCSSCGSAITMSIKTWEHPEHFSWKIENIDNKRIVMSNSYLSAESEYSESKCLPFANYKLSVLYTLNNTESNNVAYQLQAGAVTLFEESTYEFIELGSFFTVSRQIRNVWIMMVVQLIIAIKNQELVKISKIVIARIVNGFLLILFLIIILMKRHGFSLI